MIKEKRKFRTTYERARLEWVPIDGARGGVMLKGCSIQMGRH